MDSVREEMNSGLTMKNYFELERASAAALAPIDEDEQFLQFMGNDVKRNPIDNETAQTNNSQLLPRYASRSLWLVEGGVVPFTIYKKFCKFLENFG